MRLILSKNRVSVDGYEWSDVVKPSYTNYEVVIFNSVNNDLQDIILSLCTLDEQKIKSIYISNVLEPSLYSVFTGLNSDVYDNEDYLQDKSVLDYLVDNYKNTGFGVENVSQDIDKITKSLEDIVNNTDNVSGLITNKYWMNSLKTSVDNVENSLKLSAKFNNDFIALIDNLNGHIKNLENSHDEVSVEIQSMAETLKSMQNQQTGSDISTYPNYSGSIVIKKCFYAKTYGHCRYLTTFMMAFLKHLMFFCKKKARLLIILPKTTKYSMKYRNLPKLSKDVANILNITNPIYTTNEPIKKVMDAFFNSDADVHLVLDMTMTDFEITGTNCLVRYTAVSGISDIETFNLKANKCIFSIVGKQEGITIPHFNNFSENNEPVKQKMYVEKCVDAFKRIQSELGL